MKGCGGSCARSIAIRSPATIFCSGRCGELYPDVIAAAARAGHDIAGHGYTQDGLFCYMTPDEERVRDPQDARRARTRLRHPRAGLGDAGLQLDRTHL
jgi:hypothetical protein